MCKFEVEKAVKTTDLDTQCNGLIISIGSYPWRVTLRIAISNRGCDFFAQNPSTDIYSKDFAILSSLFIIHIF